LEHLADQVVRHMLYECYKTVDYCVIPGPKGVRASQIVIIQ